MIRPHRERRGLSGDGDCLSLCLDGQIGLMPVGPETAESSNDGLFYSLPAGADVATARYSVHGQGTKQRGLHGSIDHV
jgi:hypothetical protein